MHGMDDFFIPLDLSQLPEIDKENKDEIIKAKKFKLK